MTTRRLFDEDSHLCDFESRIVALRPEGPWVALEATAFYPEEGGQRPDEGDLSGVPVLELAFDEEGTIWHRLEHDPGWVAGQAVSGHVDPVVRRDHRQQHTGQHLLSRAFVEVLGAETKSFHMGAEDSTIDLADGDLDFSRVQAVEERANSVVMENRAVVVTEESRPGGRPLRTVTVEDFESQHCCGSHVRATGEVGLIKILRWEKAKGLTRVHFVCGDRALRTFRRLVESADAAARLLSAGWFDLPRTVEGALDQVKEAERRAREWRERWAALEADRLAREARRQEDGTLWVAAWIDGADAATMRVAVNAVLEHGPAISILAGPGEPGKCAWVVARSEQLPEGRVFDARATLAEILGLLGGRGGGNAFFAQGSCPAGEQACRERLARFENRA